MSASPKVFRAVIAIVVCFAAPLALADKTGGTNATVSGITHTAAAFSASITTDAAGAGTYPLRFFYREASSETYTSLVPSPSSVSINGNATTTFIASLGTLQCGKTYAVTGAYLIPGDSGYTRLGSGDTSFSTLACATLSPASLTLKYFTGAAIAPVNFAAANFNGTPTYRISPALPAGLTFNTATAAITGTPTEARKTTRYTITGTGSISGSAAAAVTLAVAPALTDQQVLNYIASHSDLVAAFGTNISRARQHYLDAGFEEGREITFDPLYYTASHPDLMAAFGTAEVRAATHYIEAGFKEKRAVTWSALRALRYIASHADLIAAFGADASKGVRHYIDAGYREGRQVTFDPLRYTAAHPDLIAAFRGDETKAVTHYIQAGFKENRSTTFSDLDSLSYVASYADLIAAFATDVVAGIRHYVESGYLAGRRIVFDALAYIASHRDLIAAFGVDALAGVRHYIGAGFNEGRRVVFDALGYLAAHADLRAAFGSDTAAATRHYINWGSKEGRGYFWTVSATAGTGGQVSASRSYGATGERVSISVTPQSGFSIDTVTGCGGSLSGTTYTTAPLSGTCGIAATFRATTVAISITANFQRPGPAAAARQAPGWDAPVTAPIPHVWIELQNSRGAVVASGYADSNGQRTFSGLATTESYVPVLRSRALTSSGFDLWVVNNTVPLGANFSTPRTRYAPYELRFSAITPDATSTNQAYSVTALTGWNSTTRALEDAKRESAPFAIIADTVRHQVAAAAAGASNAINKITILWSTRNRGGLSQSEDNNYDLGTVRSSGAFSSGCAANIQPSGVSTDCAAATLENIPHIWLSGAQNFEPMEFTFEITAHEMTHFTQQQSQRSYSPGGPHDYEEYQDIALAHHEGFATGAAVVIAQSPRLERWFVSMGAIRAGITDYSKALTGSPVGWFQETTFTRFIWRLFDPAGAIRLNATEIFAPYYSDTWKKGLFAPSMWAYGKILKDQQPAKASAIDLLGSELNITLAGNDLWGTAERVRGDRTEKQTFPVIATVPLSGSVEVCTAGAAYEYNKSSNNRYLRLLGDGTPRTYTITGPVGTVPDAFFFLTTRNTGAAFFTKGSNSVSRQLTIGSAGGWGVISDCKVSRFTSKADENGACSADDYTPPAEQCWTIKVE